MSQEVRIHGYGLKEFCYMLITLVAVYIIMNAVYLMDIQQGDLTVAEKNIFNYPACLVVELNGGRVWSQSDLPQER